MLYGFVLTALWMRQMKHPSHSQKRTLSLVEP